MTKQKNTAGFTLIEMLVYLGIFSILMGGIITVAYSIFDSSDHDQTKIILQEEGNFLAAKINWALSGTQAINSPLASQSGSMLSVNKWDVSGSPVTITIDLSGTDMNLSRASNPSITLNASSVEVKNLVFAHNYDSVNQENIQATFTLEARMLNGMLISQNFFTTKYLRK
jgi:prepilin-type N-terminal cleavage/methylation domain-containing protein